MESTEELPAQTNPASPVRGLTAAEVVERVRRGEVNRVPSDSSRSLRRILFENAFTPINTILFAISILLIAIGLVGDAVLTAGLVLGNVVVGVFQEGRAKRRLDSIALLARPKAIVLRDGSEQTIDPAEIVRGDACVLRPGEQVQVDGKVLAEDGLSLDESLLTGESDLVRKHAGDVVYSGSFCMTGNGVYEAEQVGAEGLAQRITARARSFRAVRTPLQLEVAWVIFGMGVAVIVVGVLVANSFIHVYGHLPLEESARAAAVIVALVPQGLSFMVTVTYAMAAVRIAGSGALVQRLNGVESMSHIDVLCVDKTGTLTTNELKLERLQPAGIDEPELRRLVGVFSASAAVRNRTVSTLLEACPGEARPVAQEVPFDSAWKWSGLVFEGEGAFVLGAPDVIAPTLAQKGALDSDIAAWADEGLRVLLFARATGSERFGGDEKQPELPSGLEALGLIALRDELRTDARETVAAFHKTGILLKVISGDHPETVSTLARQAGIEGSEHTMAGSELEGLDEAGFEEAVERTTVFGRISPQHKDELVQALQRRGHYVAMTGDGVNDVPALKRANVAVAMRSGSPVTRGVADIVLLNDSFAVLPAAFAEGQRIRNGMQGVLRLFLVRTLSVTLLILGASLLGLEFPTSPRQAGILSLLTVGIPAFALAVWAEPRRTRRYLLPAASSFVLPAALTVGMLSIAVYWAYISSSGDVGLSRTIVTELAVLCGLLLVPVAESDVTDGTLETRPRLVLLSTGLLALFVITLLIEPLRRFYELETLQPLEYALIAGVAIAWGASMLVLWRLWFMHLNRLAEKLERLAPGDEPEMSGEVETGTAESESSTGAKSLD